MTTIFVSDNFYRPIVFNSGPMPRWLHLDETLGIIFPWYTDCYNVVEILLEHWEDDASVT